MLLLFYEFSFSDHHTLHSPMSSLLAHAIHGRTGFRMVSLLQHISY